MSRQQRQKEHNKHDYESMETQHAANWRGPLPDHPFKKILDDKMRLSDSDQQSDMSPSKLLMGTTIPQWAQARTKTYD